MMGGGDASPDDFTFPVVAAESSLGQFQSHSFCSPMWSPTDQSPRRSFSHGAERRFSGSLALAQTGAVWLKGYNDEEERMDMLWEHLNEELDNGRKKKFVRGSSLSYSLRRSWELPNKTSLAQDEDVQVKSLKVSKGNGMNVDGKKSLTVMFKVFRRLLLLQKSNFAKKVSLTSTFSCS